MQGDLFVVEEPEAPVRLNSVVVDRIDGASRFVLALAAIRGYRASDNPRWVFVDMRCSLEPLLVAGTVGQMDAAYAAAAYCERPEA